MFLVTGATGTMRYEEVAPETAEQGMIHNGLPEPFVKGLMARYARGLGRPAPLTGEVEHTIGRAARMYAEWVADHAGAFAPDLVGGTR